MFVQSFVFVLHGAPSNKLPNFFRQIFLLFFFNIYTKWMCLIFVRKWGDTQELHGKMKLNIGITWGTTHDMWQKGLIFWYQCYYLHTSRDSVSTVCRIFFFQFPSGNLPNCSVTDCLLQHGLGCCTCLIVLHRRTNIQWVNRSRHRSMIFGLAGNMPWTRIMTGKTGQSWIGFNN